MTPGHRLPATASPLAGIDIVSCRQDRGGLSMTVRVTVSGTDPHLRGHFPGLAILPGVFVIEALSQALATTGAVPGAGAGSAAGRARGSGAGSAGRPPVLAAVRSARFLAPLLAGDELTLVVTGTARPGGGWAVTATGTRADGTTAARIRAEFDAGGAADA